MPTLTLKKKEPEVITEPAAAPAFAEVKTMASKLIQQARHLSGNGNLCDEGEAEDEVLLDLESDGVRCLILRTHPKTAAASVSLSPREQEIARMIAKGYPNKTIAAVLDISAWTVCTHIRRVFAKLGVGSRAEMVAKLLGNGSLNGSATNANHQSFKLKD